MATNWRVDAKRLPANADFEEKQRNFENLLKHFRRVELETGFKHELKQRESYEKPGEKRKRKRKEAARERFKQEIKNANR